MNDEIRSIFTRLKAERIRQRKSQGDIAKSMGIDRSQISKIETGRNISLNRTLQYARVLGIKIKIESNGLEN